MLRSVVFKRGPSGPAQFPSILRAQQCKFSAADSCLESGCRHEESRCRGGEYFNQPHSL
jgi:hypothetical protein